MKVFAVPLFICFVAFGLSGRVVFLKATGREVSKSLGTARHAALSAAGFVLTLAFIQSGQLGKLASLPLSVAGNAGAMEILLFCFWIASCAIAGLAAGYKRAQVLFVGAPLWAMAFYVSSFFLDDMATGHNAGTAIRVGALSALSFLAAAAYLIRKLQQQKSSKDN